MYFKRMPTNLIIEHLQAENPLIEVITGPRQVGKTTAANQISKTLAWPVIFESADSPIPHTGDWISTHWNRARLLSKSGKKVLLVLDEIQKVHGWAEIVKNLWDQDVRDQSLVRPLLLESSALLLQKGLSDSLAGRFFLHRFSHWGYYECREAFDWDFDHWLYYGGYPGAARFVDSVNKSDDQWKSYISDSLIDTVLTRDIFQLQTVNKPALLRQLFVLAASYPAQIFSYNKMLGQLADSGNTTTLAHYLSLLETAFLASGLEMFSKGKARKRGSSPKLIIWNNALINSLSLLSFKQAIDNLSWKGRLIENAVGAYLLEQAQGLSYKVEYWRNGNYELDFILSRGENIIGLEVKSGLSRHISGISKFKKQYESAKVIIIGSTGIPFREFFKTKINDLF